MLPGNKEKVKYQGHSPVKTCLSTYHQQNHMLEQNISNNNHVLLAPLEQMLVLIY
jgi:hypothetical protein